MLAGAAAALAATPAPSYPASTSTTAAPAPPPPPPPPYAVPGTSPTATASPGDGYLAISGRPVTYPCWPNVSATLARTGTNLTLTVRADSSVQTGAATCVALDEIRVSYTIMKNEGGPGDREWSIEGSGTLTAGSFSRTYRAADGIDDRHVYFAFVRLQGYVGGALRWSTFTGAIGT